jgi:hypothetical protein
MTARLIKMFVLSFIFSSCCYANNWKSVANSADGESMYFVDIEFLQKSGNTRTFWLLENKSKRDKFGALSTKENLSVNCVAKDIKQIYLSSFDDLGGNGKVISSFPVKGDWVPIAPGSINASIYKFVCK